MQNIYILSVNFDELLGGMGEIIHAVLLYCHHILDSTAVFAEEVDSRLNRHYFTNSERSAERLFGKRRALVNK